MIGTLERSGSAVQFEINPEHHHHFICRRCEQVWDVYLDQVAVTLDRRRSQLDGFRVERRDDELLGIWSAIARGTIRGERPARSPLSRPRLTALDIAMPSAYARLLAVALAGTSLAQVPAIPSGVPGFMMSPGPDLEVRHLFWELSNVTETWVSVQPLWKGEPPHPIRLVLAASRPGRIPKGPADRVTVYAQSDLRAHPLLPRKPTLLLRLDDTLTLDLTAAGRQFRLNYPCPVVDQPCAFDAVIADITPAELRALAAARSAKGDALGFSIELAPEHISAARALWEAVF